MEDLTIAIGAGVVLLVTALFGGLKDILTTLSAEVVSRIRKKPVDLPKHPIFNRLSNHLQLIEYRVFSTNAFKHEVIATREKVFWTNVYTVFTRLSKVNVNTLSEAEFKELISEAMHDLNSYKETLISLGLPEKTLAVMENATSSTRVFLLSLVNACLSDAVFDFNSERIWAFFTIYSEYLQYAHNASIEALLQANGNLYGETFKGITNEKDSDINSKD